MNKGRVEAFSDAIVAIIMTIMILEFKTPHDFHWTAILEDLPYLFAYAVSFFFIAVAWYNHHYMFSLTKRVTKSIYWINNIWLFTMAMIPVATAWAGEFMLYHAPEYFYLLIFTLWSMAYYWLSRTIDRVNHEANPEISQKIKKMGPYFYMGSIYFPLTVLATAIGIYFYPPIGLIATLIELIVMAFWTNDDSDKIFSETAE
ncbi:MAG: TMEM175 family protein [Enterococcus malodoratus]